MKFSSVLFLWQIQLLWGLVQSGVTSKRQKLKTWQLMKRQMTSKFRQGTSIGSNAERKIAASLLFQHKFLFWVSLLFSPPLLIFIFLGWRLPPSLFILLKIMIRAPQSLFVGVLENGVLFFFLMILWLDERQKETLYVCYSKFLFQVLTFSNVKCLKKGPRWVIQVI